MLPRIRKLIIHYMRLIVTHWRGILLIVCINGIYSIAMYQYTLDHKNSRRGIAALQYVIKENAKSYKTQELLPEVYEAIFENKRWKYPFAKRKHVKKIVNYESADEEMMIHQSDIAPGEVILCKLSKPNQQLKDSEFQKVEQRHVFVYSAFLDVRHPQPRTVKVIGISPLQPGPLYCQLYYPDGAVISSPATNIAADFVMERHQPFKYKPYFYNCAETRNMPPHNVSLTHKQCVGEISNLLPLHFRNRIPEEKVPNKILISVKTLHQFNSTYRLIEFIEFQRLMNASHVMFYGTDNISVEVKNVLNYYIKADFVSVRPWNLPVLSSRKYSAGIEIRTYGQHSQMHDCIYRYMNEYKYIIFIDKDEFIVPHDSTSRTYQDIMQHIDNLMNEKIKQLARQGQKQSLNINMDQVSSFVISNAHFCINKEQLLSSSATLFLPMIYKRNKADPFNLRTKVIVNPRLVLTMGVHKVTKALSVFTAQVRVPPSEVLLHHYRWHRNETCTITDKTASRFANDLIRHVNLMCVRLRLKPVMP